MTHHAHIDFETRSTVNLKSCGAEIYAAHPDTGIWCLQWALADDPISLWMPGFKPPRKLLEHIETGGVVSGFNVRFEHLIWKHVIARICPDWPALKLEQLDDTMSRAYARALPGSLENVAEAVNLPIKKDMAGKRIMMKMCVPTPASRKARKLAEAAGEPLPAPEWNSDPNDLKVLCDYCATDVEVERHLAKLIAPLTDRERRIWQIDQTVNDRGVRVDLPKVKAALDMVEREKRKLVAELKKLTKKHGKEVTTPNSNPQMLAWLASQGLELPNLKKRPLQRLVNDKSNNFLCAHPHVLRVLNIRLQIAKASTAKLKAMINGAGPDERVRGLFSYHVATTGRWAGRRVQLQNMPRPELKQKQIDEVIEILGEPKDGDVIRFCYAEPLPAVASCLRGLIIPGEGRRFVGGDYAGIEGRVIAWLAGETWKLQAYRDYDTFLLDADGARIPAKKKGEYLRAGPDTYKLAYSRSFGIHVDAVSDDQRQIGKVQELSLGFQGAVGAFINMGDNYGVVPSQIAMAVRDVTDAAFWQATSDKYPTDKDQQWGLDVDTWTGLRVVVDAWRNAHPATQQLWWDLQDCAIQATLNPKSVYITETKRIKFVSNREYLFCQLPSGRVLSYARPSVAEVKTASGRSTKQQLQYYGQGKKSKKWELRRAYGGLLAENATQGTARDVLADAMIRIEAAGYPLVMHVHDEPVSEAPFGFGSPEEFHRLMCDSAPWLDGCPIAAETWTKTRYGK